MYDKNACTKHLKDDLNTLYEWSAKWKMIFNPANPQTNLPKNAIFSNKTSSSYETVSYAGVEVTRVDYHKHLGFILDGKMYYTKHIDSKIAKANQGIRVIQRLYNYLPRKALLQIYTSFLRPHLDYCDVIYHKPTYDDFYSK